MAETERQTGRNNRNRSRIARRSDRLLIAYGAVLAVALIAAVFIFPRYGKVLKTYQERHAAYKTAQTALAAAREENETLTATLEELRSIDGDIESLRSDVFTMAAQLEQDILAGNTDVRICYITVDDGPYARAKKYLELFDQYDIKATFFLTTANGNKLPDQADQTATSMYPEYLKYGHTLGNHTYSHNYTSGGIYASPSAFIESVNKQSDFTSKATGGYWPEIVRFPGGTSMAGSRLGDYEEALRAAGYGWIDWTVDSRDSSGADDLSPESIIKTVKHAAADQKIMVILFHEWSQNSLDALPEIIEYLQGQNYVFLPLFYDSVMVEK